VRKIDKMIFEKEINKLLLRSEMQDWKEFFSEDVKLEKFCENFASGYEDGKMRKC
jgi:hypothetical protein